MNAIKALLVDVDGVLMHGLDGRHWAASMEADLGVDAEAFQREFFGTYWEDIVVGRTSLMDSLPRVLEQIAPHLTAHQLLAYWFERDGHLNRQLLDELALLRAKGLLIYLATNQEHLRAQHIMDVVGLVDHVDGIFYSAELGVRKPNEEFFTKIATKLEVDPDHLLLVDDTLANIHAAAASGWRVAHWPVDDLSALALARNTTGSAS